jgi:hypothetical protein
VVGFFRLQSDVDYQPKRLAEASVSNRFLHGPVESAAKRGSHKVDTNLVTSSRFTQALANADDERTEKYHTKAREMAPEVACDYVDTLLALVSTARD